jgi:8-oxo-dGTP diphosphatase
LEQSIRVGVSAVIVRDGAILLVKFDDESGPHFNLPGGGVETGETLAEALRREVQEECAAEINVGPLLLVGEYVPARHATIYGTRHKLALVFHCTLQEGSEPRLPDHPDPYQVDVEWIPLGALAETPLIPQVARHLLPHLLQDEAGTWQGINEAIAWA